jgi:hypothetical protein
MALAVRLLLTANDHRAPPDIRSPACVPESIMPARILILNILQNMIAASRPTPIARLKGLFA